MHSTDSNDIWDMSINIGDAGYNFGHAGNLLAILSLSIRIGPADTDEIWVYDTKLTDDHDKPHLELLVDRVDAWNRADAVFLNSNC